MNNINNMDNPTETKHILKLQLKKRGLTDVLNSLGELLQEEEHTIKNQNDRILSSAFEMTFLMLMDYFDSASREHQEFIYQVVTGDFYQSALERIKWDNPMQSPRMMEARETIKSFKK
jgi:hypothetical protein